MRSRSGRRISSGLISLCNAEEVEEDKDEEGGGTAAPPLMYDGEAADLGSGLMALLDVRVVPNEGDDVRPLLFNCTWL